MVYGLRVGLFVVAALLGEMSLSAALPGREAGANLSASAEPAGRAVSE
jgi:hypothetical protein